MCKKYKSPAKNLQKEMLQKLKKVYNYLYKNKESIELPIQTV